MLLTIILSALLLCSPSVETKASVSHKVTSFLEQYLATADQVADADKYLSSQMEDGTWPDIDYENQFRGAWQCALHATRFSTLASAYHHTSDKKYLVGAQKALKYWYDNMPVCVNWWYNEIGIPKIIGPAAILIKDSLSPEETDGAIKILSKARFGKTGQNKIWVAEGVMMRAYLQNDMQLVKDARDTILSEITLAAWKEGIQPDWSFHQHGPQNQWGNYGLSYAGELSWIVLLFQDTPLSVSPAQRDTLEQYLLNGPSAVLWKGYFDMNACGRQLVKNTQRTKANSCLASLKRLGLEPLEFTGGRYYPYSDFGIYRTGQWYASVRGQSSRTKGVENTNNENMRGKYASDGALLLRKNGDEYYDVAPVWNWHHVPGVTCPDDGKEIFGWQSKGRYNLTPKVFGDTCGNFMVCAMELNREGLTARKAWFFCPDCIVCLGSGISMEGDVKVVTGVEQCRINGEITTSKKGWIHHNGVTYVPLDGEFIIAPKEHSGDWFAILPALSKDIVKENLLDIYMDHGTSPQDRTYAYVTVPVSESGSSAYRKVRKDIRILSNTPEEQTVSISGNKLTILWSEGKIVFQD